MLDVDFEFFSPVELDFHGLKNLLRQLFDADADQLDLSGLADLIISQPSLGTTVKCDGEGSDPFAFLTLLDLKAHAANPAVKSLVSYLSSRAGTSDSLSDVPTLLASPTAHVALLLSERLLNMPTEIVPPLYTMLADELDQHTFTHFLLPSKVYTEVASALPSADRPKKKARQPTEEVFYFHAEDEALARVAKAVGGWDYVAGGEEGRSDAKRAFQEAGIRPTGYTLLFEAARWKEAVKVVGEYLGQA